jgi:hypothetical protein
MKRFFSKSQMVLPVAFAAKQPDCLGILRPNCSFSAFSLRSARGQFSRSRTRLNSWTVDRRIDIFQEEFCGTA